MKTYSGTRRYFIEVTVLWVIQIFLLYCDTDRAGVKKGSETVFHSFCKRDGLRNTSYTYPLLNDPSKTKRGKQAFRNCEPRFAENLSMFNSYAPHTRVCERLDRFHIARLRTIIRYAKMSSPTA